MKNSRLSHYEGEYAKIVVTETCKAGHKVLYVEEFGPLEERKNQS